MFKLLDSLKPHAHWLLRIGLASVFLFHGSAKVFDFGHFNQNTDFPIIVDALIAFAEFAGGLGIIIGAFTNDMITRLAGLAMAPVMVGAIILIHWGRWDFRPADGFPVGGMEFQVLLLLCALFFLIVGNASSSRTNWL